MPLPSQSVETLAEAVVAPAPSSVPTLGQSAIQNGGQWVGSAWNIEDWCEACTGGPCTPLPMSDSSSHADHGAGTWKVPSPAYHDHGTGAPHATWKAPSPGSYDDHGAGTWKSPSPAHHDHG